MNDNDELKNAIRDGLSNHTGEFLNPWIITGEPTHLQLVTILDAVLSSKRLQKNLIKWRDKAVLRGKIDELNNFITRLPKDEFGDQEYVLTLKGRNILDRLSKLEAKLEGKEK